MSNFLVYLKWYLCLNGIVYFKTNNGYFPYDGILTIFNESPAPRVIKEISYFYKKGSDVFCLRKGQETGLHSERLALIDPTILTEDLDMCIYDKYTTFILCSQDKPKHVVLVEHYTRLSVPYFNHNIVLLSELESQDILDYFFNNSYYDLNLNFKYHTPIIQKFYILTCLLSICFSVLTIFYLVCGIYSAKNPIVTEFELNRFQVLEYKDLTGDGMEACLICFEPFEDEDHIRILLCKHYFHKECVDRWLCKQSSRCPYCRCTNKHYVEIV